MPKKKNWKGENAGFQKKKPTPTPKVNKEENYCAKRGRFKEA